MYRGKYIYKVVNVKTNTVYIGQSKNPFNRWRKHCKRAFNGYTRSALSTSIKKYGIQAFIVDMLPIKLSREFASKIEILLIAHFRTLGKTYNRSIGGEYGGLTVSDETKRKQRMIWKNKHVRKLRVLGMSKAWNTNRVSRGSNISNALKGRCLSVEHKRNIGIASKQRWRSKSYRHRLSIAHMKD